MSVAEAVAELRKMSREDRAEIVSELLRDFEPDLDSGEIDHSPFDEVERQHLDRVLAIDGADQSVEKTWEELREELIAGENE